VERGATGLASLAHVRSRLSELFRGAPGEPASVRPAHALVVCEIIDHRSPDEQLDPAAMLGREMRLSALGETARTVFSGPEVIGRLGPDRVVVIARRDDRLAHRVALWRRFARTVPGAEDGARIWIEGLPGSEAVAALLLDELTRS
jgi:hypothetical protein